MSINAGIIHNRPFQAGVMLGLVPAMDFVLRFGSAFTFELTSGQTLLGMLALFVLIGLLYGVFGLIVIRLSSTIERQFVEIYERPAANEQYRNVKSKLLIGGILLSYAVLLIGHLVEIPYLFVFGWVIPGLVFAGVVLITPIAWALLWRPTH